MRWINILIIALFIVSLLSQPLLAENVRKMAYINAAKVFDGYYKTKEADEKLGKKGKEKNAERDKLVKEINKLKDEVQLLSKEAKEEKQSELNEKMRGLQDFDRETKLNLRRERDDVVKQIFKEIDEGIKEYGKKKGYDIIFDSRILLYMDESMDVTNDVIKELNKR